MEQYTYNFEIRNNILHFMAALDGAVVKRYDKNKVPQQSIKMNYVYAPKAAILKDIVDKSNTVRFPIAAVSMKGLKRNPERVKNKLDGYYKQPSASDLYYNKVRTPVPVDISFDLHIMAKYQSDAEQIIGNWAAYFDPYIVVSWKEPYTGYELRSKITWDGNASMTYPENQSPTDNFRIEVNAGFTFEGWLFKAEPEDVGRICCIDTEFHLLSSKFCFWDQEMDMDSDLETFHIDGFPDIRDIYPLIVTDNKEWKMSINGNFINIDSVFLSGDNVNMFPMSSFDIFPDDERYVPFEGYPVYNFQSMDNYLMFDVVPLSSGRFDVIVVNKCGYSILTNDMKNNSNPYPDYHPFYEMWNETSLSGVEVLESDPLSAGKLYAWNKYYYDNRE